MEKIFYREGNDKTSYKLRRKRSLKEAIGGIGYGEIPGDLRKYTGLEFETRREAGTFSTEIDKWDNICLIGDVFE